MACYVFNCPFLDGLQRGPHVNQHLVLYAPLRQATQVPRNAVPFKTLLEIMFVQMRFLKPLFTRHRMSRTWAQRVFTTRSGFPVPCSVSLTALLRQDGFSHPGFRTMDALTTEGDAFMEAGRTTLHHIIWSHLFAAVCSGIHTTETRTFLQGRDWHHPPRSKFSCCPPGQNSDHILISQRILQSL